MKINLEDFVKPEVAIEKFKFMEKKWFFFYRPRTKTIYFEKVTIESLIQFSGKYFGIGNPNFKEEEIDPLNLVNDLFKIFKTDERNYWLKKEHLKQQTQELLMLMAGIMITDLVSKKKIQTQGGVMTEKSPLERYLDSL